MDTSHMLIVFLVFFRVARAHGPTLTFFVIIHYRTLTRHGSCQHSSTSKIPSGASGRLESTVLTNSVLVAWNLSMPAEVCSST